MRLEQALVEMGEGGAANVVVEALLEVRDLRVPDHGAEALDGADAREGAHDGLAHSVGDEELGLGHVRVVLGPAIERDVEDVGAEGGAVALLPVLDRRPPVEGAG